MGEESGAWLLEDRKSKVKARQGALNTGHQSGEPRPFDGDAFLNRMRAHMVEPYRSSVLAEAEFGH